MGVQKFDGRIKREGNFDIVSKSMLHFAMENNIKNSLIEIIIYINQTTPGEESHIIIVVFDNDKLSCDEEENLKLFLLNSTLRSVILVVINP